MVSQLGFNIGRVHETVSAAVPDRECMVLGERRLTYAQVTDRSRRLAIYLHRAGLGCHTERRHLAGHKSGQDHLALYLYNGNEYIEGMIGAFGARMASFNVNYRYVAEELRYLLGDAHARAVVYHACFAPTLAAVLPGLPDVRILLQVADESGNALLPHAVDYEQALGSVEPEIPPVEPSPDDLYLLYTGGTTGMPKGVLWRQHDIFMAAMGGRSIGSWQVMSSYDEIAERASGRALDQPAQGAARALGQPAQGAARALRQPAQGAARALGQPAQGAARALGQPAQGAARALRMMVLPPLMHGAAQWAAFIGMTGGATLVFPDHVRRLDAADVWTTLEREKANSVTVVGDAMARPLIEELERGDYDVSSLIGFGNGGATLNPSLKQRLIDRAPHVIVSDAVGSSETGAQMSHQSTAGAVSTGRFRGGPGTVVVSDDLSRVVEPGHEGLGWLAQTGWVPLGYLNDAAKTARTFPVIDGARYAVPGDRARWRADGEIELLGRDAVIINSGGEKIFAEEVEQAIAGHPAVHDVAVAGRASERWGQEVVALVALSEGASVSAEELSEHASGFIARYKLPKQYVFLPAIQRSPSGKADYRWARQQVGEA